MAAGGDTSGSGTGPGPGGRPKPRVVVLGGGFGGLESAFSLRAKVGERAAITLVSDSDHFYFKPNSIYVPFGLDPAKLRIPLERPARHRDIELVQGRATEIDPDSRSVTVDGDELSYDFLVVATGAGMRASEIAGLADHGLRTWTAEDMVALREAFDGLLAAVRRGDRRRVVFLVPPQNKCSGPLYEIVLMLDTWLRKHNPATMPEISWTTYEAGFIQAFGPRLHDVVTEEFERRGISGHTEYVVEEVTAEDVRYANGESLGYDLLVSFPPYVAANAFPGLPADERGFLRTELATRQVAGHPEIYAVGDAGDFPVKQAFLAFLQADAAAAQIASRALDEKASERFDPISMCVMEQFDKATFAKVPLRLTGDPERPVEVRPGAEADYQVGSSRTWRMGKKMLGLSVPWRFRNGRPFHSGPFWSAMEVGLGGMARLFATSGGPAAKTGA
ncbi:MAG TPA: FAD-dependent oxidoreductase [Solirubrobacterales bacterium]|nr:FAD-dependent oxidoreductase [Solirubrobacterales bacterium]